jgi:hypothetical protein
MRWGSIRLRNVISKIVVARARTKIEDQEIKAMWSVVELEAEDEASNAYHRLSRPQ